ncbi:hypothetical protein [Streptomyces sp. NPDC053560]|uniref:hypothetical protein n=1 Tax=Streptomyces sp. NPDC053560 TaxID=3365711 RepID=UPI0037D400C6
MDGSEIDSITRSLDDRKAMAEVIEARRDAEEQEPPELSIIPTPEFLPGGIVRCRCPRGCGFHYDVNPGLDAARERFRVVLPADPASTDVSDALTARAAARGDAQRARIESAIAEHYEEQHGAEPR